MYLYSKTTTKDFDPFEEIKKRLYERRFDSFIYVVPTRRKIRFLIRELIELAPDKAIPSLNIFTIGDLAEEIFKAKFKGKLRITSSLQFFLIKKILTDFKGKFKFFTLRGSYIPNGLIDSFISVIKRLKELGISEADFSNEIKNFEGHNRLKAEDISLIYTEYQYLINTLRVFEIGDVYLSINRLDFREFENIFYKLFPRSDFLLITGFNEFTIPELKLIEFLAQIKGLETIITLDFTKDNEEIFGNLFETHQHLLSIGFKYYETDKFEKADEFHRIIKKNLFKSILANKVENKSIFKFTGFDARDEVETIAKIIKLKVQQNPQIDLSKICIAIQGIENYSNLIREIFYKYGIPVNVTDRFYLKNSSPVISIIRLLDLLKKDFFYEDLFYVLRSPYFDLSSINDEKIDVGNLRKTLELLKITRGKNRILSSINSRIEYLNQISPEENLFKESEIKRLEKAKKDFQKVLDFLEPLKNPQTSEKFVSQLLNIIKTLKVYERIFDVQVPINEDINLISYSKDIRSLNLFEKILEELIYSLEKLNEHRRTFTFDEFYNFISSAIFGARFNVKERWGYGVLVTTPEEIRGLSFSILFMPGMENGIFPSPYRPLIFLEEKFIRNERQKLLEERYLFYQTLNAFEKELYLSYPKQDEKKLKIVSDFLVELEKIFVIKEFNKTDLVSFILAESELFERFSVNDLIDLNFRDRELLAKISRVREIIFRMQNRIKNKTDESSIGRDFCGIITDEDILKKLYNQEQIFSITELETFALCPFKYFINYIIKPESEKEIEEDIERNEFGIIIHNILHKFLLKLKKENRNFYEELKTNKPNLLEELKAIAFDVIKIYERLNPFFFLTEEIILGNNKRKSILEQFLDLEEIEFTKEVQFVPSEFEKEIKESFSIDYEGFIIRGKIDRIDLNEEKNIFKVIDYKTGGIPSKKDYEEKVSFQLPLYLYLVKKYYQSLHRDFQISDAEFIKLSPNLRDRSKKISFSVDYLKDSDLHSQLNETLKIVADIIKKIRRGEFNLTTIKNFENRVCSKCDYKSICRIDSIKKEAKNY